MRRWRLWASAGVFALAAAAGFLAARPLAPERLHAELEERLTAALGGEVHMGELRVTLGWGLRLEASDLEAWPGDAGPALRVARAMVEIRPFAHLTGQRRLRRLRLEDAVLRLRRSGGGWSPEPLGALLEQRRPPSGGGGHPHELLRPLVAVETFGRRLLGARPVADHLELRRGRIEIRDAGAEYTLAGLEGRFARRTLLGDTLLRLRGRLSGPGGTGTLELDGHLERSGELRLALATTELELEMLAPVLARVRPRGELAGSLSGAVVLEAQAPGDGRFELDLVARELRSSAPGVLGPLEAGRAELSGTLAISPQEVRLEGGRLANDALALELDGRIERPLHLDSAAELALALHEVDVSDVRHLIAWLPAVDRAEAEALLANLESGHLALLRTGGTATLSGWQAFLAGRTRELPRNFVVDAELSDTHVRVGERDRIEALSGRLWWAGDRVEIRGARARLNGSPLPELDFSVEGISRLFASDPADRRLAPGARPLAGLRPLWLATRREDDGPPAEWAEASIRFERLDHPMFFWPLEQAVAHVRPRQGGLDIALEGARWAGVPVHGEVVWLFEPGERVEGRLVASASNLRAAPPGDDGVWARGSFEMGASRLGAWQHAVARGDFLARETSVLVSDATAQLLPAGELRASARLDLGSPEAVPFELQFALEDADLSAMSELVGLPRELATGQLDAGGALYGRLAPDRPPSHGLGGLLDLHAREGTLSKAVPAVVAVALASEVFNPFAGRHQVKFERLDSLLELDDGRLHTDGLELDGPDVRAFATGGVDLVHEPHPVDVDLALFLFRPVDGIIEKIPIVNVVLLGRNENLVAAHLSLEGPWEDPRARLVPLRSLATGPASLVFETMPDLVKRGLEALGSLFSSGRIADQDGPPPPAVPGEP